MAALYAADATYRSHPMRDPEPGGALGYVRRQFAVEQGVECWFGEPVAGRHRAAVEWWASLREGGAAVTLAGTTLLRFEAAGQVTDHVDYWVSEPGRRQPWSGWGRGD